jgi:caa(3)-type oxidase subunit IV
MSTATATAEHDEHVAHHPTDAQYVKIALILGVITAFEVATYFWKDLPWTDGKEASTATLIIILFPMMIAKFAIVCGYFMHLKYDNHLFRRVFVFGLGLATVVYMIVFFAFDFMSDDYLKFLKKG